MNEMEGELVPPSRLIFTLASTAVCQVPLSLLAGARRLNIIASTDCFKKKPDTQMAILFS